MFVRLRIRAGGLLGSQRATSCHYPTRAFKSLCAGLDARLKASTQLARLAASRRAR